MHKTHRLVLTAILATPFHPAAQTEAADAVTPAPPPIPLVRFEGAYADLPEAGGDLTSLLLGDPTQKPKSFYTMRDELAALEDADADTVLVDLSRSFQLNLAHLAELERTIGELRRSGKKLWAYVENAGPTGYQIAALCDQVMIAELGMLDLPSAALSVMFMKDAFDLLGIETDIVRCGDFKGAVEPYMLPEMSKHLRAHYAQMLERINGDVARRIASGRHLPVTRVRELQAQRMFTAKEALAAGLVDHVVPWRGAEFALGQMRDDEFETEPALATKKKRKSFNPMQLFAELFAPKRDKEVEETSIAVLHLSGTIVDGIKSVPGNIVSGPTVETIEELASNDEVKGVVVRINSPGGSATASEAILLALGDLAQAKPVAISMGRLAASGGYYVTCIGRPVFAEPGTITGSIGVFGTRMHLGPIMRRIGLNLEVVALDESATADAIDRPWSAETKERVQSFVDNIYDVFVGHVARSRSMSMTRVLEVAGGRVWSGEQAVKHGLVDRIGGLDDAIALVATEAGIEDYDIAHVPQPKSFMDALAEELLQIRTLLPPAAKTALARRAGLDHALRLLVDSVAGERPATVWAMMPAELSIR